LKINILITIRESRDSFLYDKKTLERKSREKNRERLGIFNEDELYDTFTRKRELEELKYCTFKPNIYINRNLKVKDLTASIRSESKDVIFNKLYEVINV